MRPRSLTVGIVATVSLALAGCSGTGESTFEEALGSMGGLQDADQLTIRFVDVADIRETVGYQGDGTDRPDPADESPATAWGHRAANAAFPNEFATGEPAILSGTTMSWSISNYASLDQRITILHDTPDAAGATQKLADLGWTRDGDLFVTDTSPLWQRVGIKVADENIMVLSRSGEVTAEPDAERSALADDRVQALLECLDDPQLAYLQTIRDSTRTIALAATVDADGAATVRSCIHAPGEADGLAATLQPNNPDVLIESREVDGDVITSTLRPPPDTRGLPSAAQLIMSAPETPFPGF